MDVDRQMSVGAINPHAGDETAIYVATAYFGPRAVRQLNCIDVVAVEQAVDNATNGAAALRLVKIQSSARLFQRSFGFAERSLS